MARNRAQAGVRYDREVHGVPGDIDFYVGLARRAAPVLELGCGTGRITLAIAGAGVAVVGLDSCAAMLDRAREKTAGRDNPAWLEGDMRSFELGRQFALVVIPYRSLQLMPSAEDCRRVLERAGAHLLPHGRLAFDVSNVPWLVEQAALLTDRSVQRDRARGLLPLSAEQVGKMLAAVGFAVEEQFGGFQGQPFTPDSSEQIWIATPAAATPRPAGRSDK